MPPPSESASDAQRLSVRLCSLAGRVLGSLPACLHQAWVETVHPQPEVLAADAPGALNTALLMHFDLRWPDVSAAEHGLELAWLLSPEEVWRVCASRALFAWRSVLIRSVDAAARRRARALIGEHSFDTLASAPRSPREVAPAPMDIERAVPLGWMLLAQALPWRDPRSRRLIELMLPPVPASGLAPGRPLAPMAGATNPAQDHTVFLALLPALFPEHSWLFGSELATLKSA